MTHWVDASKHHEDSRHGTVSLVHEGSRRKRSACAHGKRREKRSMDKRACASNSSNSALPDAVTKHACIWVQFLNSCNSSPIPAAWPDTPVFVKLSAIPRIPVFLLSTVHFFYVDCPLFLRYPTRKKVDSSKNPAPRKILKCGAILGIPSNSNSHLEHISIIEEQTGNFFPLSTFFLVGWRCRVKDSLDPLTTIWTSIFDFCTNFA